MPTGGSAASPPRLSAKACCWRRRRSPEWSWTGSGSCSGSELVRQREQVDARPGHGVALRDPDEAQVVVDPQRRGVALDDADDQPLEAARAGLFGAEGDQPAAQTPATGSRVDRQHPELKLTWP